MKHKVKIFITAFYFALSWQLSLKSQYKYPQLRSTSFMSTRKTHTITWLNAPGICSSLLSPVPFTSLTRF